MINLFKRNKHLRIIIIACILLIIGVFICFKIVTSGIHGEPITDEGDKISKLFYEINKYQQGFFIRNNRYGSWQELGQEYFSPQTFQVINSFKIFKIVLWADKKSFQCVAGAPYVVYKIDETSVLKQRLDFGRGSIITYFKPNHQAGCYDLENPIEIDKTNMSDIIPNSKK